MARGSGRRRRAVEQMRARLLRSGWPRYIAFSALLVGGAAGFLTSVGLLELDLTDMAIRYPIAASVAYGVFLLALRAFVWLARHRIDPEFPDLEDAVDIVDVVSDVVSSHSSTPGFDASSGGGLDLPVPDADEGIVILIPILVLVALGVAVFWSIALAPTLVAELFVDAFIVSAVARRFARNDPGGWLDTALRRTWKPFLAVLVLLTLAGFLTHLVAPGAESIGDVLALIRWA